MKPIGVLDEQRFVIDTLDSRARCRLVSGGERRRAEIFTAAWNRYRDHEALGYAVRDRLATHPETPSATGSCK